MIEDNDDAADTLAMWLEELGPPGPRRAHRPEWRSSWCSEARRELVLCDVGLPGHGRRRGLPPRAGESADRAPTVMVALTGWGKEEDRQRTDEAGFDHHLVKPVALSMLSELLGGVKS